MREMQHKRNRGQAYALEGIIGAIIVVSSLVLGLQAVDIAPWTGQDDHSSELRVQAADTLDGAQDSDALRVAVTCLDEEDEIHPNVASTDGTTTEFGEILSNTIEGENYRIHVDYPAGEEVHTADVDTDLRLPDQPTATVSRQVALFDSDTVYEGEQCEPRTDGDGQEETLGDLDDDEIYLENQDEDSELYSVVRVRVVIW